MARHIKIGLIVLGLGSAVTLGFFVDIVGRIRSIVNERETIADPFTPPDELYAPTDPPMAATLFYVAADRSAGVLLASEEQSIFRSEGLSKRAQQILQRLIDGPQSQGRLPSIPKDARIEEVFVSRDGIAFVDFSNAISANHPGGIVQEQATIYSIVNSLLYNLPELRQVKILIGGTEKETLAGHCLLSLPLDMDLSITDLASREAQAETETEQTSTVVEQNAN